VLGAALTQVGDLPGAESASQRAGAVAPGSADPPYYLAAALYTEAERMRRGGEAAATDKYRAAADAARRATELKPDLAEAHVLVGLSLKALGRPDEAVGSLVTALRCRPEAAGIHQALGETLADAGRRGEAADELRRARDLAPDDPGPREALERLGAGSP